MAAGMIALGTAVVGGISKRRSAKKGGKEAEKLARREAELIGMETEEELRRMEFQQEQILGETRASIGASGLQLSGSSKSFLDSMEEQFGLERDWLQASGAGRADFAREGGASARRTMETQGQTALIQGVGSGLTQGAQMGYSWWGS